LGKRAWAEAIETDYTARDVAWIADITRAVDLSNWPEGSRLIVRKERTPGRATYLHRRRKPAGCIWP
jgi:hypothetical protein